MELEIKHTPVYTKNLIALQDPNIRFIINQGGSRSSKTTSICQMIIVECLTNAKTSVSIVRKSFPALRGSVMRDFFEIMESLNLYIPSNHNKTEQIYKFDNGSTVEFFSVDDAQKLRGRKRDILFGNEANELSREDFQQLNMRTTRKLIFDYNPSDLYSWVYDIIPQSNSSFIKSTYKDNPFLSEDIVKEIDNLINVDEGYYKVYALGEQASLKQTIFSHYSIGKFVPGDEYWYGLDIGYNHPTALVQCSVLDNVMHLKEKIYSSNLTTGDLIMLMDKFNISKTKEIICDSARPDVIEELKRNGYNAKMAHKAVKEGIIAIKSRPLIIDQDSFNLIKEFRNYKWKMVGDQIIDEPVKLYDDGVDASRYAIYHYHLKHLKGSTFDYEMVTF